MGIEIIGGNNGDGPERGRLQIHIHGDSCWSDLAGRKLLEKEGRLHDIVSIARMPGMMENGKSSIAVRIDIDDHTTLIAETSLAALHAALRAFHAADAAEGVPMSVGD